MVDLKDIHPLTAFKRNTTAYMKQLKQSRNPLVLTVNGKAEMVVLDAESYQDILDRIEYVETVKAQQQILLQEIILTPLPIQKVVRLLVVQLLMQHLLC